MLQQDSRRFVCPGALLQLGRVEAPGDGARAPLRSPRRVVQPERSHGESLRGVSSGYHSSNDLSLLKWVRNILEMPLKYPPLRRRFESILLNSPPRLPDPPFRMRNGQNHLRAKMASQVILVGGGTRIGNSVKTLRPDRPKRRFPMYSIYPA